MRARPHDGGAAGFPGGRARAALTLIEVMVALAVMAALAAVVLPAALSRVREASVAEVGERLGSALVQACVEAQRRGEVLEVVVLPGRGGEVEVLLRRLEGESDDEQPWIGDEPLATLPAGVRVMQGGAEGAARGAEPGGGVVLGIVLPDGTVEAAGAPVVLEDADRRRHEVRVSRWDAKVTVATLTDPEAGAGGLEELSSERGGGS